MNKSKILTLLILTLVSCGKENIKYEFKQNLIGKSFNVVNSSINQDFEFQDSTIITYGLRLTKNSYQIKNTNDSVAKLIWSNDTIIMKKRNSRDYDFVLVSKRVSDSLIIKENKPKYNKEKLFGVWEEKTGMKYKINDRLIIKQLNDTIEIKSTLKFEPSLKYLRFELKKNENRIENMWHILEIKKDTLLVDKSYKTLDGWTTVNNVILTKKR